MSKHHALTEEEFAGFTPPKRTLHYLEEFRRQTGCKPSEMNILEWGCGRGRETLWLRERGYNAFGVDLDPMPLRNAAALFARKGHDPAVLRALKGDGRTDFDDGYFHFTYSDQVFEHVRDLEGVARELSRVTRVGGEGMHVFPAFRYLVEGHLFMPLVHWLPKNRLRMLCILLCTAAGREPHWPELEGASVRARADTYFRYSVDKTFYRSPACIKRIFEASGFRVAFETINHPRVASHPVLSRMIRNQIGCGVINYLLLTFVSNELHLVRDDVSRERCTS